MDLFKTMPMLLPFMLNTKITEELETKGGIIDFLRKMNIQHSFKQMPGKPIKLGMPIVLTQPTKVKITSTKPKSKKPTEASLVDNHEDEEEYVEKRSKRDFVTGTVTGPGYLATGFAKDYEHDFYYLNNKPEFIKQIKDILMSIQQIEDTASCDSKHKDYAPLTHQLIVQRYLNLITPYRGLLLYHGLGSGKTCSSITIMEGMVSEKQVFVMTPASLQANYRTQMRFCGNQIFRNNNHWVYERIDDDAMFKAFLKSTDIDESYFKHNKKLKEYILKQKGIWITKPGENNYESLNVKDKERLDEQIDIMIKTKYNFINFNGLRLSKWNEYTKDGTMNPFDNSIVIIDEAHNFVSRIVNKLEKKRATVSTRLYEAIMEAENCRVVLLTGTPFINYPSELGTLFNLIHGYNNVLGFRISYRAGTKPLNEQDFKGLFNDLVIDSIEYKAPYLKFTKTPYGFIKIDNKMKLDKKGEIYFDDFKTMLTEKMRGIEGLQIIETNFEKFKLLPDTDEEFNKYFVTGEGIKNKDFFQKKIVGMVSYIGDNKQLMPDIIKSTERVEGKIVESDIHVEYVQMSKHQIDEYSKIRDSERPQERMRKDKKEDSNSTYRVFSRAACNFAFPFEPPQDRRPMPGDKEVTEDTLDAITDEEKLNDVDGKYDEVDLDKETDKKYLKAIKDILDRFDQRAPDYFESDIPKLTKDVFDTPHHLKKYSPKFYRILQNLMNPEHVGCHLLYTNFRKLEGIGLLRLILLYYGYSEMKIVKFGDMYSLKLLSKYDPTRIRERRCFALYTGTETAEEKEIIRNIYNNNYDALPNSIKQQLKEQFPDPDGNEDGILPNIHGEVIQLLMITASGAEGIDLKNTRFVHITEPYWHHVRINQVIGRARRICSHTQLEKELQDVMVFLYISYFGDIDLDGYPNIKNLDSGESTDMKLYNIMRRKEKLSSVFLNAIKETAIDCKYNCFKTTSRKEYLTEIDYTEEKLTAFKKVATKEVTRTKKTIEGLPYVLVEKTNPDGTREGDIEVYAWEDYGKLKEEQPVEPVGILVEGKIVQK